MTTLPPLESLGRRICILGPSGSGKSTLADAIGRRLDVRVIYLDRLRHLPGTDWEIRPNDAFKALHDEAAASDEWVMDGNYSAHFPVRFARATGIIWLRGTRLGNFVRYLRRTLTPGSRIGGLEGNRDSLKWTMVKWVLVTAHKNLRRYGEVIHATGLPVVELPRARDLDAAYRAWGLTRGG